VDHLDHGTEHMVSRRHATARARHQQEQRRPKSFAAVMSNAVEQCRNRPLLAPQRVSQDALDLLQVVGYGGVQVEGRTGRFRGAE
jgi:hypothetical protein